MRAKAWLRGIIGLGLLIFSTGLGAAGAPPPLVADPPALAISGTLEGGALLGGLRLKSNQDLSQVQLLVSDLADVSGDGWVRDPLPAARVAIQPAELVTLTRGSVVPILIQVTPPKMAGTYAGTLWVHWERSTTGPLAIPLTVTVRGQPQLIIEEPAQLSINGVQGQTLVRHLTLREQRGDGSGLRGLQGVVQDLTSPENMILSADRVQVTFPADGMGSGELLTATVQVDLRGVPAGTYTGQVLLKADPRVLLALPLTINVRHQPWVPGLVLLIGVALGLLLSAYQGRGKPRDELVVRITGVRNVWTEDPELKAAFGLRLMSWLEQAEEAVRSGVWADAQEATRQAEQLVSRWRRARTAWIAEKEALEDLLNHELAPAALAESGNAVALRQLRQEVEALRAGMADHESPAALHTKVQALMAKLKPVTSVCRVLQELQKLRIEPGVAPALQDSIVKALQPLQERFVRLPAGDEEWEALKLEVRQVLLALETRVRAELTAPDGSEILQPKGFGARGGLELLAQVGTALREFLLAAEQPISDPGPITVETSRQARRRLWLNRNVLYVIGGLFLAGTGWETLYLARFNFGVRPVADYLALLGWGLGAQTSFAAVIRVLQEGGVSWLGEKPPPAANG